MNANEVIANLCNEKAGGQRGVYKPIHPNDHVNMGQSSNDIIPTTSHLAALLAIHRDLKPALDQLATSLEKKAKEFDPIVKAGPHAPDGRGPGPHGQEFGGYAMQVRKGWEQIERFVEGASRRWPSAGTATGTGINSHPEFREARPAPCSRRSWASRCARPATTSRRRAAATTWRWSAARSRAWRAR